MGIWLEGWAGDHAGKVEGREPNRLLIALTHTDANFPSGLHQKGDLDGITWYFNLYVTCLTPGAMDAIATAVDHVGDYVWSIEVTEMDWGLGKDPWNPGVHLFSVMLLAPVGNQSGTMATALIEDNLSRFKGDEDYHKAIYWDHMRRRDRGGFAQSPPSAGRGIAPT